jgi:predicted AlkP superfamily phosphohydrolase/phosphomutase
MNTNAPILMIGLDAAEVTLIEQLCATGRLPAIQSLRERGCFGTLETSATLFAGGVWPTFYTAKEVAWHGIYHNKQWRHAHMRCEVVEDGWLSEQPFWKYLDDSYRVAIIDMPMTVGAPHVVHGLQLAGWGTHDLIVKGAWPSTLWKQLEKEVGPPRMPVECFGPQSAKSLLTLQTALLQCTEQMTRLSEVLLRQGPWDLFCVVFGALHRGGHYLWDLSQIDDHAALPEHVRQVLQPALVELYQACDRAVARLLEMVPASARILVFAVHGMGPNPGWADYCREIITRIQRQAGRLPSGVLYRLKKKLPWSLVRQVTSRLPPRVLHRLVPLWSAHMCDWRTTRYFPLPMDHAGYLRLNVRGREPEGIVEPGADYEATCQELTEALCSFRDLATDQPIVERVYRLDDLAGPDAPHRDVLPDLVLTWSDVSAIQCSGVRSEAYGEMRWHPHGKLPSGRSGNHRGQGWFVAMGDAVPAATRVHGCRTVDLVPTVFHWLGVEPRADFQGQPIPALCGGGQETPLLTRLPPQR